MKSSLLPLSTLLLGVILGLIAGWGGFGNDNRTPEITKARDRRQQRPDISKIKSPEEVLIGDLLNGRAPAAVDAEEAYQLLRPWFERQEFDEINSTREGMLTNVRIRLLVETLPVPILEQVLFRARGGDFLLSDTRRYFGAYAARDWQKAMEWAAAQPDAADLKRSALESLSETDPERAAPLVAAALRDGGLMAEDSDGFSSRLGRYYGGKGLAAFCSFIEMMAHETEGRMVSTGMKALPPEDVPAFLEYYRRRENEGEMPLQLDALMPDLVDSHPEEYKKWLETQPPQRRSFLQLDMAATRSASGRMDQAREYLKAAVSTMAGNEREFLRNSIGRLQGHPELIAELLLLLPRDVNLRSLDAVLKVDDPFAVDPFDDSKLRALDVAKVLPTPAEKADYLVEKFNQVTRDNPVSTKGLEELTNEVGGLDLRGPEAERVWAAVREAKRRMEEMENSGKTSPGSR